MTDYTPTYEEVAFDYASSYGIERHRERVAAFDRWLAAHDAEVYERGREDAERDVFAAEALPFSNLLPRGVAAAAARGDGDCQHDWQHLKGEKCATCRRCGAARGDGAE